MVETPYAEAGSRIRARRIACGFTSMEAIAAEASSSPRMVSDAERGIQVGEKTRIRISRALGWTDSSIDRLYANDEPIEVLTAAEVKATHRVAEPVRTPAAARGGDEPHARAAEIQEKLELIPDVYEKYGPDAARAAVQRLGEELAELRRQLETEDDEDHGQVG